MAAEPAAGQERGRGGGGAPPASPRELSERGVRRETADALPFRGRAANELPGKVWESHGRGRPDITRIVFTERPLDALSHFQLKRDEHTLYVSTGGPLTAERATVIQKILDAQCAASRARDGRPLTVVAAFSNSVEGAALGRLLQASLPPGVSFERDSPIHGRTWNDTLQAKERAFIRSQGVKGPGLSLERKR